MATSYKTTTDLVNVILKHVSKDVALKILEDLANVEGNKSFKDSVQKSIKTLKATMDKG
jgi:hypothetical protein